MDCSPKIVGLLAPHIFAKTATRSFWPECNSTTIRTILPDLPAFIGSASDIRLDCL